jgi:hypothetical protein
MAVSRVKFTITLSGDGREEASRLILESVGGMATSGKNVIEVRGEDEREHGKTLHSVALSEKIRGLSADVPDAIFTVSIYTSGDALMATHSFQDGKLVETRTRKETGSDRGGKRGGVETEWRRG